MVKKRVRGHGLGRGTIANSISLNDLFLSLQEQLRDKMQTSRRFVHHCATKGAAAEQAWLTMLKAYLPERYKALAGAPVYPVRFSRALQELRERTGAQYASQAEPE